MRRTIPWPFPADQFPDDLGAVVQRTVLQGALPALMVAHAPDGSWLVADGVNDPNEPDASVATHLRHVVASDPSLRPLASLAPGTRADRATDQAPWIVTEFTYEKD